MKFDPRKYSARCKPRVLKRGSRWLSVRGVFVYSFRTWSEALACALEGGMSEPSAALRSAGNLELFG